MQVEEKYTERTVNFRFRRHGLTHLADVKDYHPHSSGWGFTSAPHHTHCGLWIPYLRGMTGTYSGAKRCPRCFPS